MNPKADEDYEDEAVQLDQGGTWSNQVTLEPDFLATAQLILQAPALGSDFMGLVSAHQNIIAMRNLSAIHQAFEKHDKQLSKR